MTRHQARIVRLCASLLRNASDAEDAAQEVFFKAYSSLARFQKNSSFYTWLYRIASNHCLGILRTAGRHRTESWDALIESQGEKIQELFTPAADPRRAVESADLVSKILSTLKPNYKLVLTLREVEGLSYAEIAHVMDCSADSVKAQIRRARAELEDKTRHFLPKPGV